MAAFRAAPLPDRALGRSRRNSHRRSSSTPRTMLDVASSEPSSTTRTRMSSLAVASKRRRLAPITASSLRQGMTNT